MARFAGRVSVCIGALAVSTVHPVFAQGVTRSVAAGGNLQTVLDAAQPGDTILLPPGATFRGNFVLRAKTGDGFITLRTADGPGQPAPGVRATAAHAPALAKLQSSNSAAALRTAAGAHHWRIELLQFGPNKDGYGDIIDIGDGGSAQNDAGLVPYTIVLDRIYVAGDPLQGQKRGVGLNARDVTITSSTIRDIKTIGQDTQAIGGWNGPGPYLIENNYLEAAGENVMFGGADPHIDGLTPTGITFRHNYVTKPVDWKDPIVPTPTGMALTATAGALAAGTYSYRVVARRPAGQSNIATSAGSAAVPITVDEAGGVVVTWTPVPNAAEYRVYRIDAANASAYWTVTQPSFTDLGAAGTAGAAPDSGTRWVVKNIFELKNANDVLIEQNVFENNWEMGQTGYAIVFTVRNSNGACVWCTIQNVEFRYNIVRHTGSAVNILGLDGPAVSVQADRINIHDNLFYDVSATPWGGSGWFVQIGMAPKNLTIDHNTVAHTGTVVVGPYGGTASNPVVIPGFRYTNNLSKHGKYGFFASGMSTGLPTINAYFPDGVITANVLAGGSASKYPPGNLFPTVATHMAQFVSPPAGDYSLVAGSSYERAGLDGRDLGADIAQINAGVAIAIAGDMNAGLNAVHIDTASLAVGIVGAAYSATIQAGGGSGAYTWSATGTLPAGITFNTADGSIGGTPLEYGSWPFSISVTDATDPANTATQAYTLSVRPTQVQIVSETTASMTMGVRGAIALQATGGTGAYRWRIASGTLPPGVTLDDQSGTISGTPTATGSFTAAVEVADSAYPDNVAQGSEDITVVPSPVVITTTSLPSAVQGSAYAAVVAATGGAGPLVWSIADGALPSGLTLDAQTGVISGTPTAIESSTVTIVATDSLYPANTATQAYTLSVRSTQVQIVSAPTASMTMGMTGAIALEATGGTGAYRWRIVSGTLPPGVTLDDQSGTISGTPTATGSFTAIVEVTDAAYPDNVAQGSENITVVPPAVLITTTLLPPAVQGSAYSAVVAATGGAGPLVWSIVNGALPSGLTLDAQTGVVSGTPTSVGSSTVTIGAADSLYPANTASATFTLTVNAAPLAIVTESLPDARQMVAYSTQLQATGGVGARSWQVISGTLPAGITLAADGTLSGKCASKGIWTFTLEVRDSAANAVSRAYTLTVRTKNGGRP